MIVESSPPQPSGATLNGTLTITSRRLLWCPSQGVGAWCGELARVVRAQRTSGSGFFRRKHKLRLSVSAEEAGPVVEELELRLEGSGHDDLEAKLNTALSRRAWARPEEGASKSAATEGLGFTTSRAGVGGLIRRQEAQQRQSTKLAAEAFSDLASLMANAREIIAAAERLQAKPPPPPPASAAAERADLPPVVSADQMARDAAALEKLRSALGIASPVTRESAGTQFHQQLARQARPAHTTLSSPLTRAFVCRSSPISSAPPRRAARPLCWRPPAGC